MPVAPTSRAPSEARELDSDWDDESSVSDTEEADRCDFVVQGKELRRSQYADREYGQGWSFVIAGLILASLMVRAPH